MVKATLVVVGFLVCVTFAKAASRKPDEDDINCAEILKRIKCSKESKNKCCNGGRENENAKHEEAMDHVPPNKVEKIDCKKMEKALKLDDGRFDFCVKIGFPKGERVLYGGLTGFADDQGVKYEDILEGKVIAKKAEKWLPLDRSRISMNVKPKVNKATMVIHDGVHGHGMFQLTVDLKSKRAEPLRIPKPYYDGYDDLDYGYD